jgi:organic hydroperoxide reductase OsmC/OhrA
MAAEIVHTVTVSLVEKFEFLAAFEGIAGGAPMLLDEPPPLGQARGPNAAALLAAAVANCLAASLAYCLRKARATVADLTATATVRVGREGGRFRVVGIDVGLTPVLSEADQGRFARCEAIFEDFCIVTESVRKGIPVNVNVSLAEPSAIGDRAIG